MKQAPNKQKESPVPDARPEQRPSERKTYCVYNQTRECFLSLEITVIHTIFSRLRGLIGRFKPRSDEGLWVMPSWRGHTLGLVFPRDMIYLDEYNRVVDVVEYFPSFRITSTKTKAKSVLELPTHTIYSSQTQPGDQILIYTAEEMEQHLRKDGAVDLND